MTSRCPACEAPGGRPAFAVREFSFRRCASCDTLFLTNPPEQEQTSALYADDSYYTNPDFGSVETGGYHGYKDYLADRGNMEHKFRQVLEHVEEHVAPGRLLDVGAGPGFMVAAAAERGWDAVGVDLNPWACAYARRELGVDVREQGLEEGEFADGEFDAVTMLDLLEHVSDPEELVAEAARITRPGGALALLTPDAGSLVGRMMGARWPEARRAPEHMVLFSVSGLAQMLQRHGYRVAGWHSAGKTSTLRILAADVAPFAPGVGRMAQQVAERLPVGERTVEFDPRTKFVLYAVREDAPPPGIPRRIPKHAGKAAETTVAEDLAKLARARRLADWMFAQFRDAVRGRVVEVGAGIGTFSQRVLDTGAERLLLIEPEPSSAEELERLYAADDRVRVVRDFLPDSPALAAEPASNDLVLCQNVLEHIEDDAGAVRAMGAALRPGGQLTLLVPAHPRLFNSLDRAYGHHRRYDRARLTRLLTDAGLEVTGLRSFNLLGVAGWVVSGLRGATDLGTGSLALYDVLVAGWRPVEERLRPRWGLSLVAHARRPA